MVTAETAAVLPVLALVVALALWAVAAAGAQVRCADAAREAARAAARGDPDAQARAVALRVAPPGSTVSLVHGDGEVRVSITANVRLLGHAFVSVTVAGAAVAAAEPTS